MQSERPDKLNLPKGENLLPPEKIGDYFYVVNPEGVGIYTVDICQPRGSSTARAILNASAGYDEVHFQPWKFVQRYSRQLAERDLDPNVVINQRGDARMILLKETPGGPNDRRENFDPVQILLEQGVREEQVRAMVGLREPFAQFASWKKFDDTRQADTFLKGQHFVLGLLENYKDQGITVVPFVFELLYPNPGEYLLWIYNDRLGLENITLPKDLRFAANPKVTWHEANPALDNLGLKNDVGSRYYERVVKPIAEREVFAIPQPKIPILAADLSSELAEASRTYLAQAANIYQFSVENGLPRNTHFESYLKEYSEFLRQI